MNENSDQYLRDLSEQEIGEIFRQAKRNENVLGNSDYKRINAIKDYLKFETFELNNQKGGEINIDEFIIFRNVNRRYLHKFQYEGLMYEMGFKNLPANLNILNEITYKCFNKILEIALNGAKKSNRVRVIIEHPSIPDQPISLPYMP